MTYHYYTSLIADAKKANNKMKWIAEYGYPADCPYSGDNLLKILSTIYETAHQNITALIEEQGGIANTSAKIGISHRTVQNWKSGLRKPSTSIITLIGYALIGDIPIEQRDADEEL